MGDDIGSGLSSMAVCFDFRSTNVVQLSNRNPYFYWFRCHHPLITQLTQHITTCPPPCFSVLPTALLVLPHQVGRQTSSHADEVSDKETSIETTFGMHEWNLAFS